MTEYLHHPIVQGAVTGLLGAALADFNAFKSWKSFHDAATYAWGTAIWRWFQGALIGAVGAAGWSAATA